MQQARQLLTVHGKGLEDLPVSETSLPWNKQPVRSRYMQGPCLEADSSTLKHCRTIVAATSC